MIPLILIMIGGFLIRVLPQLPYIFTPQGIMLQEVDPYFNFRLLENMVVNFPNALAIDSYANFQGMPVGFPPLMNWIATVIVKCGASPIMVAVWMPPILGALLAIPVYLIGKELFSKHVGLIAAFLTMILPCEVLHRSLLGFYDHHVLEATFFFWALYFLIKFSRTEKVKWAVGAGLTLGLYLITWLGGMFGVTILAVACGFEVLRVRSLSVAMAYSAVFATAGSFGFIYHGQPYSPGNFEIMPIIIASPLVAWGATRVWAWLRGRRMPVWGIAALTTVIAMAVAWVGYHLYAQQLTFALSSVFWGFGSIIGEAQPSYPYVWVGFYGVSAILMFGGIYFALKRDSFSPIFLISALVFFVASIGQRRWSYYFGVDVALLSGLLIYQLSKAAIPKMSTAVTVVCLFFVMMPLSQTIIAVAKMPTYIDPYYYDALTWMRQNTIEPFSKDRYLSLDTVITTIDHGVVVREEERPSYTVLAWWDYGHWINEIAHRVPLANPAEQMSFEMRAFWMSQNEDQAEGYLKDTNVGLIFCTEEMTDPSKFYAVLLQLGEPIENLEQFRPNSMAVRMWTGEGITKYTLVYQNAEVKIYARSIG